MTGSDNQKIPMKIYKNYDEEPEDIFLPITRELYSDLYSLEMDTFSADIEFYQCHLPESGNILEIGCGSGRVCRQLADHKRKIIAIDISIPMLKKARNSVGRGCHFLCMDMLNMAFSCHFNSIIIPYNTLNLLPHRDDILTCLHQCTTFLADQGRLCLQLYLPALNTLRQKGKTFQFQMFDRPTGGKVIKEVLKKYNSASELIEIEERFRIRPMKTGEADGDYNHFYTVAAFSFETWLELFWHAGFILEKSYGNYELEPVKSCNNSILMAVFQKK